MILGFVNSLRHGDRGEQFVISLLTDLNFSPEKDSDLTNPARHDILCRVAKKKVSIEVKYDIMSEKTGNIAIEVWNPKADKPSGLTASTSDLWFHLVPDGTNITCWIAKTSDLVRYTKEVTPKRVVEICGDNNSTILLYSNEVVLGTVLQRLENLERNKAIKLIKDLLKGEV